MFFFSIPFAFYPDDSQWSFLLSAASLIHSSHGNSQTWFLACHCPGQRLLMTPLPPPHSIDHFMYHTVFLYLLSHLNHNSLGGTTVTTTYITKSSWSEYSVHSSYFSALVSLLMLFSLSTFFPTLNVPTFFFNHSRPRLNFSCFRKQLIPTTKSALSLHQWWCDNSVFIKHLLCAGQCAKCCLCVIFYSLYYSPRILSHGYL